MRSIVFVALAVFLPVMGNQSLTSQTPAPPAWPDPPHQLLIVGTFHFVDAGADSYRPRFDVDMLSPERQAQIAALVEALAAFEPTQVAVEVMPSQQGRLDSLYDAYTDGRYQLGSNEIFQLGFRLAAQLGHDGVHAVDARRRFYEPWVDPDSFALANGQRDRLDPRIESQYRRLHRWDDEAKTRRSLRDHLLYLNEPSRALRSHGQYLTGNFEVGTDTEYPGVDSKTAWFNRNLKIFANVQRLVEREHERILLIIGSGHLALLRHAAEASPEFHLVELADVLSPSPH